MTVYELIQKLAEFEPDQTVAVGIYDQKKYFDDYMEESKGCENMDIIGIPTDVSYPTYSNTGEVEIVCEVYRL